MFVLSVPLCAFAEEAVGVYNVNTNNTVFSDNINTFGIISDFNTPENSTNDFEVEVNNITDSSAVLSWKSSTVYLGYTLYKYNLISKEWEFFASTPESSYRMTGLPSDTDYRISIRSGNTDEVLGITRFTTITKKASVNIDEVASEHITLSFENVEKHTRIELYRSENGTDFDKIATVRAGKEYTDKHVEEGKTYFYRAKCYIRRHGRKLSSEYSTVKSATTLVSMDLPKVSGKTKTFAYYTAVTVKSSPQYKLLNSKDCYTDPETGIRMVDGFYCVALGSYYGSEIGTKYRITVSSGNSFNVILCDQKSDRHTDKKHQYARRNKDILEFYVEKKNIPAQVRGSYDSLEQFRGKITSIEKYVD